MPGIDRLERFDIVVLGSGGGGHLLAWHMARSGHTTAVVERPWTGGSLSNIAWMPSENEISCASILYLARLAKQYRTMTRPTASDMKTVHRRMREVVDRQIADYLKSYKTSGAELILGRARLVEPKTIQVKLDGGGIRLLAADNVIVNLETHDAIPNVPGLATAHPLTLIDVLKLDYLPRHLIVIGGGYRDIELAQAYRRFGSHVTVIASAPQLMSREDADISQEIQHILSDEGIQVILEGEPLQVFGTSRGEVTVVIRTPSTNQAINGTDILVAVDCMPNTTGLGLKEVGVELDSSGYILVNDQLQTSAPGVWAIGECAASPPFTHISEQDFSIVRDNLAGGNRSTRDRPVTYCVSTDPPLARVGLSEREASRQGIATRVAKLPMDAVPGAQATDQREGFMKALIGDSDDRILGFMMIGAGAGEVMAAVHAAMLGGLSYSSLADAAFAHSTMAEGLHLLFSNVPPRAMRQTPVKLVWSS